MTLLESTMYFMILRPKVNGVKLFLTSKILLDTIMILLSEKLRKKNAVGQMELHMCTSAVGARLEQINLDLLHTSLKLDPTSNHREVLFREKGVT